MIGPRSGVSKLSSWSETARGRESSRGLRIHSRTMLRGFYASAELFRACKVVGSIPVRSQALLVSHLEMCCHVVATAKSHEPFACFDKS